MGHSAFPEKNLVAFCSEGITTDLGKGFQKHYCPVQRFSLNLPFPIDILLLTLVMFGI